jgi:hypothetical protein
MSVADEVVAIGEVRNRRLFIQNRREFDERIARLSPDWQLEISVRRLRANRSIQQSRYYWGVVVEMLSEYTGFTPDEMHEWLKMKFIPKKLAVCDGNGEVDGEFVVGGSTRKMTTTQFEDYMRTIREWAAEKLDVVIPDPDGAVLPVVSEVGNGWGV